MLSNFLYNYFVFPLIETDMPRKKMKVLVVEDDGFLLRAVSDKLQHEGYEVLQAVNGNIGLQQLREQQPDLVLLDLVMPGRDGFSVLTEKRGDESIAGIPVIVLSNLGQESDVARAKDLGALDYFIKAELPLVKLMEVVRDVLASHPRTVSA